MMNAEELRMKNRRLIYRKFILGMICFLVFSLFLGRVRAQAWSLDSIFYTIETQNPELKRYDAVVKAMDAYAEGAKSLDPPQVGGGFWMTPYNPMMWKPEGNTGFLGMGAFMISAEQMIMNPAKLNANATYIQSMSAVDAEMQKVMRNELFAMAKMSYYEWMVMKRKLKVLIDSENLLSYMIQSTELRYTYGMDKLNAFYKAKAMLGDIQNMKIMATQEANQKRIELNTLMNREKEFVFDIDTVLLIPSYENESFDSTAIEANRSDFRVLEKSRLVLQAKQRFEQSKALPDFGIKYDHMFAFGAQPQQFSLMAMVTIPIVPWSSKMYKANVNGLHFELDALRIQQQGLLNQIAGQAESLQSQLKSKKQQLDLTEKAILPAMKRNYDIAMHAYEQNTEELFMVLDAWQNLKMVQLNYLDQLMELLSLQVEFEKQLEIR